MKDMFSILLVMASQVYAYIQIYQDIDSKCMGVLVCQLHLSKLKSTQKSKIKLSLSINETMIYHTIVLNILTFILKQNYKGKT